MQNELPPIAVLVGSVRVHPTLAERVREAFPDMGDAEILRRGLASLIGASVEEFPTRTRGMVNPRGERRAG